MLQIAHVGKLKVMQIARVMLHVCKLNMLQIACIKIEFVTYCTCCKLHALQFAQVANCMCCKLHVQQIAGVEYCRYCKLQTKPIQIKLEWGHRTIFKHVLEAD